jgi:hypothetical protein
MRGMTSWCVNQCLNQWHWPLLLLFLSSCSNAPTPDQTISINVSQDWQLQPGDQIAGYTVTGGLGDISIDLSPETFLNLDIGGRKPVYAPFTGKVRIDKRNCLYYTTAEVPAYMFRLCGLTSPKLGPIAAGQSLGQAKALQFATLRKQPNGKWAIVEPDKTFIEKLLKAP